MTDTARFPFSAPARPELAAGRRVGILLSHGFTGSPRSIRPWAEHLADRGFAVEVPLLPGHGTTWQDLNTTGWSDWLSTVTRSVDALTTSCDQVFVGGLSMGGALALRVAADRPDQVAGAVVVNPALATARKDVHLLGLMKHLVPAFPGIGNDIKKPGIDEGGYPRTPLRAAHSMMAGWKQLRADLARVRCPVLVFKSAEDHVVDPTSLRVITDALQPTQLTTRVLDDSYHVATLDNDAATIFSESAAFIDRLAAPRAGADEPR